MGFASWTQASTPFTREERAHPRGRELRVAQQSGGIGEPEQLRQVHQAARALLSAHHREMRLVAVEPREEHHARLVEARRRREDVARQRHGGRENGVEPCAVAGRQRRERRGRGRRDGIEDPEQRVGVAGRVAADQLREVEVVARVHADALRQARAQRDFLGLVEQRHLDAIHFRRVGADDRGADVGGAGMIRVARETAGADPVAGERRVEHLAQPVQDDRRAHLRQHASVDPRVIVGRAGAGRQRAARHQDDAAAGRLDRRALLLVGGDDLVEREIRAGRKMVRAGARKDDGARDAPRFGSPSAG